MAGTPSEVHFHNEGFRLLVSNRDGAHRLMLALPTPSGDHSHIRMYKHQKLMGDTPISMAGKQLGAKMHFISSNQNTCALKKIQEVLLV